MPTSASRSCLCLLLPLAMALLSVPVQARTVYEVEVIVFENLEVPAEPGERWHPDVIVPRFDRTVAFEPEDPVGGAFVDALPADFAELSADEHRLEEQRRRLEDSERYRVLRHAAWRQPALEPDEAVSLRIRAGEPMEVAVPLRGTGPLAAPMRIEEILMQGSRDNAEPSDGAIDSAPGGTMRAGTRRLSVYPLDGTVRIDVRRYVHVSADLYYTVPVEWTAAPADPEDAETRVGTGETGEGNGTAAAGTALGRDLATGPDGQPVLSYPFRQHRRMRSRELHYLDHPVIGMLVLVTPRTTD